MYIRIGGQNVELISIEKYVTDATLWFTSPISELPSADAEIYSDEGDLCQTLPLSDFLRVGYQYTLRTDKEVMLEAEILAQQTEVADLRTELEDVLQSAREGLLSVPVPGENWDERKWYRSGDVVTYNTVRYESIRTCRGRTPGDDMLFWKAVSEEEGVIYIWSELESGTSIVVGDVVSHNDRNWRCLKTHVKSLIRQPSAVQAEYWEAL